MLGLFFGINRKGIYVRSFNGSKGLLQRFFDCPNKYLCENLNSFDIISDVLDYENRWKEIKKKYKKIKLCAIYYGFIGEFIARALIINEYELEQDEYIVIVPDMSSNRIANEYVLKLFDRRLNSRIEVMHGDNLAFWKYVFRNHYLELDDSLLKKYVNTRGFTLQRKLYDRYLDFNREEKERGKIKLKEYGITSPYVCVAARTANYNNRTNTNLEKTANYDFRNMEFETFKAAVEYLNSNNIATVRMGREEDACDSQARLIDYAGKYANDFMDFFLASECKFFVCCPSGIAQVAGTFGIPCLFVNAVIISYSGGGVVDPGYNYFIPKKIYDNNKKKYLSIREFLDIERKSVTNGQVFIDAGIEFIDNTEYEIMEAVKEMNERLDGTWIDGEQDIINRKKYEILYEEMKKSLPGELKAWGGPLPAMLCSSYMRNNEYLLN